MPGTRRPDTLRSLRIPAITATVPRSATAVAVFCAGLLATGGILRLTGQIDAANAAWAALDALLLVPLSWSVARALLRRDVGVDAIALVSMAGALALGEFLAGAVIALMLAGGNALEERAGARARRELTALVSRAPRSVTRVRNGNLEEVGIDDVIAGDVVYVRAGQVLPVDGVLEDDEGVFDESALTGESLPVLYRRAEAVRSGTVSAGALHVRATRPAAESAYAALVRLVQGAESQRAPFVRMADRYALWFLPLTLLAAAIAWTISGDPVRALAVFVVATPCPLILAAPIALLSGVSRAARIGIVVKGAAVIERLGSARTVLLDKTGTVTLGTPTLAEIGGPDGIDELESLRLAASLDLASAHPFAAALVREAHARGLQLDFPRDVTERPGHGIEGTVAGRRVAVGSDEFLQRLGYDGADSIDGVLPPGHARALVGVDGSLACWLELSDPPREGALDLVARLHASGVVHVAMLSGDRAAVAEKIGALLNVDRVYADQSPEGKLAVVTAIRETTGLNPVVMVGDGINDAPALALADVGVAMGSSAASASTETADAIIVVDRIDRIVDAIEIGRRSLGIARQSVLAGMGLSLGAMVLAGFGFLAPIEGALFQEAVDVGVILNALRALRA
jgi:heavy metal translocating P-type ATPase